MLLLDKQRPALRAKWLREHRFIRSRRAALFRLSHVQVTVVKHFDALGHHDHLVLASLRQP